MSLITHEFKNADPDYIGRLVLEKFWFYLNGKVFLRYPSHIAFLRCSRGCVKVEFTFNPMNTDPKLTLQSDEVFLSKDELIESVMNSADIEEKQGLLSEHRCRSVSHPAL